MVQLYEFAIILQPKKTKDGDLKEEAELVVEPTTILARDTDQATLLAGRAIPEEFMDRLERLTLAVRPF